MTVLWSTSEHHKLVRLVNEGKTNQEISDIIGRTKCAISARAQEYKLRTGSPVEVPKMFVPKTELICEAEVPDWYALGWRFIGFYGSRCKMEWVSSKPERRPVAVKMLEAA